VIRVHPIKESTGYALAKVCKAHRGNVGEQLAELELHVGQEMVLIELFEQDGLRGGEVTKMLRRLEKCGLVERRQDSRDARSLRVYLTGEGRSLEEPLARCWEMVEEGTFAGMSVGERRTFRRLLAKVRANIDPNFAAK
jgi:DNA-binding MarR family transcriptional regulator